MTAPTWIPDGLGNFVLDDGFTRITMPAGTMQMRSRGDRCGNCGGTGRMPDRDATVGYSTCVNCKGSGRA